MKCQICKHGEINQGSTTVTLEQAGAVLVFKNVPALVCDNCGEEYVDEQTTNLLLGQAQDAIHAGAQFDVRTYQAA